MNKLTLPSSTKPLNLRLPPGTTATMVDADMYDICGRVAEISPRLLIILLAQGDKHTYAIMEECDDGEVRLVYKVKELDARVLERLRYIMSVPFAERIAKCEKENYDFEQAEKQRADEEFYERMGRPMLTELEKCGFIDRPTSYAKRGVTGGKGSLKKS